MTVGSLNRLLKRSEASLQIHDWQCESLSLTGQANALEKFQKAPTLCNGIFAIYCDSPSPAVSTYPGQGTTTTQNACSIPPLPHPFLPSPWASSGLEIDTLSPVQRHKCLISPFPRAVQTWKLSTALAVVWSPCLLHPELMSEWVICCWCRGSLTDNAWHSPQGNGLSGKAKPYWNNKKPQDLTLSRSLSQARSGAQFCNVTMCWIFPFLSTSLKVTKGQPFLFPLTASSLQDFSHSKKGHEPSPLFTCPFQGSRLL